jgi:hypothetical protein
MWDCGGALQTSLNATGVCGADKVDQYGEKLAQQKQVLWDFFLESGRWSVVFCFVGQEVLIRASPLTVLNIFGICYLK